MTMYSCQIDSTFCTTCVYIFADDICSSRNRTTISATLFSFAPHTLPRFSNKKKKKKPIWIMNLGRAAILKMFSLSLSLVGDDSFHSPPIYHDSYTNLISPDTHTGIYVWSIFNDEEIPQRWYHPLSRLSVGPSKCEGGRPRVWYLIIIKKCWK